MKQQTPNACYAAIQWYDEGYMDTKNPYNQQMRAYMLPCGAVKQDAQSVTIVVHSVSKSGLYYASLFDAEEDRVFKKENVLAPYTKFEIFKEGKAVGMGVVF